MSFVNLRLAFPLIGMIMFVSMSGCKLKDITADIALVKVNEVSLESTKSEFHLKLNNPSIIPVMLNNIDLNISVADQPLMKIVKKGPINIKGHSSTTIVFPLSFRFDSIYSRL